VNAATSRASLADARRVVVKIGSSSLTGPDGHLDLTALRALADVLADRIAAGGQVVLVSSGAIAAGIGPLGLSARPRDLATMQAAAMLGQSQLVARYTEAFAAHGQRVGQVLLTAEDTVRRVRYRNAQRSLERLLALGVVPVVNENDAVTVDELKFGDNDRLAALVSHLVRADALVLLTDVDGLHDAPPSRPGARRIPHVADLADVAGVEVTARGSAVGTGGMVTKLESVRIATGSGVPAVLTSARHARAALAGEDVGTFFAVTGRRTSTRRIVTLAPTPLPRPGHDPGAVFASKGDRCVLRGGDHREPQSWPPSEGGHDRRHLCGTGALLLVRAPGAAGAQGVAAERQHGGGFGSGAHDRTTTPSGSGSSPGLRLL
jgi:glutamate 5-kinase